MPMVEVYEGEKETLVFAGAFDFLPRVGEHIARDRDGYFRYYHVVKVWFRSDGEIDTYRACVQVTEDD